MTLEEMCSRVGNFIAALEPNANAFEVLAREVFAFQFEKNLAYRAFCNSRKVNPSNLAPVEQIPAVVTSAFKDLELTVLPATSRTTAFHSSGTTAQRPSRHFHSSETLALYEKSLLRWFKPHLLPDRTTAHFLILAPRSTAAPRSSLAHMFEAVVSAYGESAEFSAKVSSDGGWELDFKKIVRASETMSGRDEPVIICGTAFSFVHLCDYLDEQHLTLSFPADSRVFETGGYKARSRSVPKSELHQMISERLRIPQTHIISEYGMSELSSQAYDRAIGDSPDRIFRFPPWARASIISPETGELVRDGDIGLVRVLDLANVGSVSAIQTEDLACRRGSGFEWIGRAQTAEPRGCSLLQAQS